jgi:hypothetical protein
LKLTDYFSRLSGLSTAYRLGCTAADLTAGLRRRSLADLPRAYPAKGRVLGIWAYLGIAASVAALLERSMAASMLIDLPQFPVADYSGS